jgi:Tol biopolymer transport system component
MLRSVSSLMVALGALAALALPSSAVAASPGKIVFVSDRDGDEEVFVMNADGTGQTQLTFNSGPTGATDDNPSWSPNGRQIVFLSNRDPGIDNELWIMNADGTGQNQLTSNDTFEGHPDWAPDGRTLVVSGPGPSDDLFLINADGSGFRPILASPDTNAYYDSHFSPDGQWIAFVNQGPGDDLVSRVMPDGTGQQSLTSFEAYWPDFTGDGKRITFESNRNPLGMNPDLDQEIFSMNADGADLRQLTATGPGISGRDAFASPSRDGLNRIAFLSRRDPEANPEIFVMNADGGGVTQLTNTGAGVDNFGPDWQPTAACRGKVATIVGTAASESLTGGPNGDVISGQGGKDTINGLGGNDTVCGDAGKDRLNGGKGKDVLNGGKGNDKTVGGKGKDTCIGGKGSKDKAKACEKEKKIP